MGKPFSFRFFPIGVFIPAQSAQSVCQLETVVRDQGPTLDHLLPDLHGIRGTAAIEVAMAQVL